MNCRSGRSVPGEGGGEGEGRYCFRIGRPCIVRTDGKYAQGIPSARGKWETRGSCHFAACQCFFHPPHLFSICALPIGPHLNSRSAVEFLAMVDCFPLLHDTHIAPLVALIDLPSTTTAQHRVCVCTTNLKGRQIELSHSTVFFPMSIVRHWFGVGHHWQRAKWTYNESNIAEQDSSHVKREGVWEGGGRQMQIPSKLIR